jgi:Mn-dependent DtxR family transcriptional regulator
LSSLNTAGLIEYPRGGHIVLTDAGARKAHMPDGGRGTPI